MVRGRGTYPDPTFSRVVLPWIFISQTLTWLTLNVAYGVAKCWWVEFVVAYTRQSGRVRIVSFGRIFRTLASNQRIQPLPHRRAICFLVNTNQCQCETLPSADGVSSMNNIRLSIRTATDAKNYPAPNTSFFSALPFRRCRCWCCHNRPRSSRQMVEWSSAGMIRRLP